MKYYKIEGLRFSRNKKFLKTEKEKEQGYKIIEVQKLTTNPNMQRNHMCIMKITDMDTGEVIMGGEKEIA
jgi:hypothetical protein